MSYNFLAEAADKIDWRALNQSLIIGKSIEYIPMPGRGKSGGDALGFSIPSCKRSYDTWGEVMFLFTLLNQSFNMEIYDLYFGIKVEDAALHGIKENLYCE